jgi:hypothetical protein
LTSSSSHWNRLDLIEGLLGPELSAFPPPGRLYLHQQRTYRAPLKLHFEPVHTHVLESTHVAIELVKDQSPYEPASLKAAPKESVIGKTVHHIDYGR